MRKSWIGFFIVLMGFGVFVNYKLPDDDTDREIVLLNLIMQGIQQSHYKALEIDDDFSKQAFNTYIERLDYYKRFLLQNDIEVLNKYKTLVDNQIRTKSIEFFNLSVELLNNRIDETRVYYKDYLTKPIDFNKKETYETDPEKFEWAKNSKELKERWRKYLKFQVLTRLYNDIETQEKAAEKSDTVTIKSIEELEEKVRKRVLESHDNWFSRIDKLERIDRLTVYINSLINVFDPHTVYFPPKDKENFDISMSGRLEGIGAQLQEKDGYIKVTRIVPGSACWKQGELEVNDVILKVAQADAEPVDVVDMRLDKAVQLIRGPKGTEVRLSVKKIDGTLKIIPIIRDIVILDETYAKSAIITNTGTKSKIGLINLPKFYADFNQTGGRSCAKDVKAELLKLKNDSVQAIILDLRNNGGGSLQDVVKMAGLFIEKGPVVQIKSRNGEPHVLKDFDPSVVWDGPLVIMVNKFSASASEIIAAALQDYNRAVIVGSNVTHGKGTVQRFIDLDKLVMNADDIKPLGSIKLTTQKFYRVDGRSTQLKGVTPDVIFPDRYTYIEVGEQELEHPLQWDEIDALSYETWKYMPQNANSIQSSAQQEILSSNVFTKIDENAKRLENLRENTTFSLKLEEYSTEIKKRQKEAEAYKDLIEPFEELEIINTSIDNPIIANDTAKLERINNWHERLQKDAYVFESICILEELLK